MRQNDKELLLRSSFIPSLKYLERGSDPNYNCYASADSLESAEVFDCRSIPTEFIDDTGAAAYIEAAARLEKIRLPYDNGCYFEFEDGFAVLATTNQVDGRECINATPFYKGWYENITFPGRKYGKNQAFAHLDYG